MTSPLVDTHAHLCDPGFDLDLTAVLDRASAAGIETVVAVGENADDARRNLALAASDRRIRPAAGLFPTLLDDDEADALVQLLCTHRDRFVAVGEVGLDFWKVKDPDGRRHQERLFRRFVQLALELDLPLNVHSRSTGRRTIEILREAGARRVQLHAFDGRAATAQPAVEAGYYFSIPPSVVRSPQKQKLVRRLPLERLLVETDSPVLGPDPQTRNEPANALIALREIATLKQLPVGTVHAAVASNTLRLYGEGIGLSTSV